MNNLNKELTILLAGVAIGVALGVLFAPEEGSETRRKLNVQGKKIAGELSENFDEETDDLTGLKDKVVDTLKKTVNDFLDRV